MTTYRRTGPPLPFTFALDSDIPQFNSFASSIERRDRKFRIQINLEFQVDAVRCRRANRLPRFFRFFPGLSESSLDFFGVGGPIPHRLLVIIPLRWLPGISGRIPMSIIEKKRRVSFPIGHGRSRQELFCAPFRSPNDSVSRAPVTVSRSARIASFIASRQARSISA
jgi:hypothetical protein